MQEKSISKTASKNVAKLYIECCTVQIK